MSKLVLTNACVLDPRAGELRQAAQILIEDGKIVSIGGGRAGR